LNKYRWIITGVIGCLVIATAGYFWGTGLMTSLFDFRSPLKNAPPSPGAPLGTRLSRKVVIVLIDGLRNDTATNSSIMPFLDILRGQGASAIIHSKPPSSSEPGYTTILTGAWPDINDGPAINHDYDVIPTFTQDDIFSAVHRAGLHTAISGLYWFEKLVPQSSVDGSFYTQGRDATSDKAIMKAALPMLTADYQLVLIHLDQVDYAGHHLGGPMNPSWSTAAKQCDFYLQEIVAKLDLKQDTVIVLSDHGQIDRGGHGGPEPVTLQEPFVMAGAGVLPNQYPDIYQVDVAPTVAALLGTNLPASNEGLVQTEMLKFSPADFTKIKNAEAIQKQNLMQVYETAIHSKPHNQPDPASPFSFVIAMNDARANRLATERPWRVVVSLFLIIPPAFFLIVNGKKKMLWVAGGALIYILLFNFRYAILDGKTYSFSSFDKETWLILYSAITTAVALTIVWVILMFKLHSFDTGAQKAAESSLVFVLMVVYFLSIPILVNFSVNGFITTWTLPEFYTNFAALLSLFQWAFVAIVGLLLTGLAALIARFIPQPARKYKRIRR
jgi:hypothetical protein